MSRKRREGAAFKAEVRTDVDPATTLQEGDADWSTPCSSCDEIPTVHPTRLCGPCCFGDAHTAGGNW